MHVIYIEFHDIADKMLLFEEFLLLTFVNQKNYKISYNASFGAQTATTEEYIICLVLVKTFEKNNQE